MRNKKSLLALVVLAVIEIIETIVPKEQKQKQLTNLTGDITPTAAPIHTTVFISADLFEDDMCEGGGIIPANFVSPPDAFGDGSPKDVKNHISKVIKTIETAKSNARADCEEDEE